MEQQVKVSQEQQFNEVVLIIQQHRSKASQAINQEVLLTAWHIGGYVSAKLKSEEWGRKVVSQLSEFIRSHHPEIKGYSRSSIYNMVMLYDEYSSLSFQSTVQKYLRAEFVQPVAGQLKDYSKEDLDRAISPHINAQSLATPIPKILTYTTLTNLIEITCRCKSDEERLFYILYAHKEQLAKRELQRCISNQTYATLLGSKKNMSRGLLETYPNAPIIFKDTLFVDFLGLPQKHSEVSLKSGLIEHKCWQGHIYHPLELFHQIAFLETLHLS